MKPGLAKAYEVRLGYDNAIFVRPHMEVLGAHAVTSIRSRRNDEIAPEGIYV